MTAKDFKLIADILAYHHMRSMYVINIIEDFANELGTCNARFDRERFVAACLALRNGQKVTRP